MNRILKLQEQVQILCSKLNINYTERAEFVRPGDEEIHLTFTYDEEEQVDRLIRAVRMSLASFGPEYWLPESHPSAKNFQQGEKFHFRIRKSLIQSHMYWGVTLMLNDTDQRYSLVEDTQP